jgi:hypothetical protein
MVLPLIGQLGPAPLVWLIGLALFIVALAVTIWVVRHGMDDPDARAERYRDRFR